MIAVESITNWTPITQNGVNYISITINQFDNRRIISLRYAIKIILKVLYKLDKRYLSFIYNV